MGIPKGQIEQDLGGKKLRKNRSGGDGGTFPFRMAKVTRVDPKRMTVSLYTITGNGDTYENVSLTQAGAGSRHFLGAIPDINDLCVIGYSSAESGYSRTPHIVGWVVPGVDAGYDWVTTSPTSQDELALTPAMRETLKGSFGRRRHKLRQMEIGNIVGSSAQGSDMVLNESVTLANRRGNELILRDQDQAIVTRSLQQFHAGAGVRTYSGMVQRDATILPTQMFLDDVDWCAAQQVDSEGKPLASAELEEEADPGALNIDPVFSADGLNMGVANPKDTLQRGLYIDNEGRIYDEKVVPDAVYGGKPIHRVSVNTGTNGALKEDVDVFTEWRVEVSHTADGTLPVTEQTDGIDIDRLLPNAPTLGSDGTGDPNPMNRSINQMMAEMVLGTAIGNDAINDRESYGLPLVPVLYDKNGQFAPGLVAAGPKTPVTEHAAFLLRVKNPTDPKSLDAFMAITKGGAFRSYFPGAGSKSHEEYYQTGKRISLGQDLDGQSMRTEADGAISLRNTGKGRPTDNIGVEVRSEGGAVEIFAGGINESGGGDRDGLMLRSAQGARFEAVGRAKISGQTVDINDADVINESANSALNMNAGEVIAMNSKVLAVVVNGKADYNFGGPKNALPTNGASRSTTFSSTPVTGGIGGVVDAYEVVFGNRSETFRLGKHESTVNVGSFNVGTMAAALPSVGPGAGVKLSSGLPFLDNKLKLDPTGSKLSANVGNATLQATKGQAVVQGSLGVSLRSPVSISMTAPSISVRTPTPFIGGVLTDGCINPLTGRTYLLSGSMGVATFRVGV